MSVSNTKLIKIVTGALGKLEKVFIRKPEAIQTELHSNCNMYQKKCSH